MSRVTMLCGTLLCVSIGCGDPKGSAGGIGAPVQSMDPSKMNKSAKDAKIQEVEQKYAPADEKAVKLNPAVPDAQQKVLPTAPVDEKVGKATPVAPVDQKLQ